MSLTLAPIHDIMNRKVLRLDRMSEALLKYAETGKGLTDLRARIDAEAPAADTRPLSEIVDSTNIHGWLDRAVNQSERRFASVVAGLLAAAPDSLDDLRRTLYTLGESEAQPANQPANDAYLWLNTALLEGMPCDRTVEMQKSDASEVVWQTVQCPHAPHWMAVGLSVDVFYDLRAAWLSGVLSQSGLSYTREDTMHRLFR